ncbi:MAG TPA: class I SAM-dependent methyltransferase [Aggregatilineales bacterium]|nr:class I SAM-dependent methyltransferase [Aggregatilineales bacterium]
MNKFSFWLSYLLGRTPWNTGIVPPEVVALAAELPAGRALDLGCGTGTSSVYLTSKGWAVTGVDFVPAAIQKARLRARQANVMVDFLVADASRLDFLHDTYDLALDVGCLHSLNPAQRRDYAAGLARLVNQDGRYLLYAFMPRQIGGRRVGFTAGEVAALFANAFEVSSMVRGQDKGTGPVSAWYWLRRK